METQEAPQKFNQPPRFMHMKHLQMDVVEAAKARIRWCLDNFDEVWCSFSGGKDSLVVLTLMEQVYAERGWHDRKIKVKFMDEELVCDDIIDFVFEKAESGKYDFHWYALEMYVGFYVMGKHKPFVSWDKTRKWHRTPPDRPYVIYDIGADTKAENENTISKYMYDPEKRTCEMLGLRADESMKRYLSVKAGGITAPNYLSTGTVKNVYAAKPIYDWTELDVFKFLKDHNIKYCPFYDIQVWAKTPLRVASTMHERGQAQFFKMKELAPKYYEQLRSVYPEIETHYRYGTEMAVNSDLKNYPPTFDGIRQYIYERIDPSHQEEALEFVKRYEVKRAGQLRDDPNKPLGGVSVLKVFNQVINGRFVKGATLMHEITQADIDYESSAN